ncbi:hypothetical protein H9P43_002481 [Blastocladiella emersonii ATCC 22665]|nr:hypothetical protein H9P43_002481 [Blastocladiella emersonii ATCC 22665]
MKILPYELIEEILIRTLLLDVKETDPRALLHVAPDLKRLRKAVFCWSLHKSIYKPALAPRHQALRDELIRNRGPTKDPDQRDFYYLLLCASGHVDLLDYWMSVGVVESWRDQNWLLDYYVSAANVATENGHAQVLEWMYEHELIDEYMPDSLDIAAREGHVDALDWWASSDLEFFILPSFLPLAARIGYTMLLEQKSHLIESEAVDWLGVAKVAVDHNQLGFLAWLVTADPGRELECGSDGFWAQVAEYASSKNNTEVLDWIAISIAPFYFIVVALFKLANELNESSGTAGTDPLTFDDKFDAGPGAPSAEPSSSGSTSAVRFGSAKNDRIVHISILSVWLAYTPFDLVFHAVQVRHELHGNPSMTLRNWKLFGSVFLASTEILWFAGSKETALRPTSVLVWLIKDMVLIISAASMLLVLLAVGPASRSSTDAEAESSGLIALLSSWILVYLTDLAVHGYHLRDELHGRFDATAIRPWKVGFAVYLAVTEVIWFSNNRTGALQPNLLILWLIKDVAMLFLGIETAIHLPKRFLRNFDDRTAHRDSRVTRTKESGRLVNRPLSDQAEQPPSYDLATAL